MYSQSKFPIQSKGGEANVKGSFGPFFGHVAIITEHCAQIVKVSSVKSGETVKTCTKQP